MTLVLTHVICEGIAQPNEMLFSLCVGVMKLNSIKLWVNQ